jgi:phosphatidylserine decarboxylase
MSLAWCGRIRADEGRGIRDLPVRDPGIALERGAELGWFNMGSTVVVLFGPAGPALAGDLGEGRRVQVGERLAMAR